MSDLATTIGVMRAAFPRQEFPATSVKVYAQALADLDPQAVEKAVRALIDRVDYLPSIASIRREAAEQELQLPGPIRAWEMVQTPKLRKDAPAPVRAALDAMGGPWALRNTDRVEIFRAQFVKAYTEIREAEIREYAERGRAHQMIGSQTRGDITAPAEIEQRYREEAYKKA